MSNGVYICETCGNPLLGNMQTGAFSCPKCNEGIVNSINLRLAEAREQGRREMAQEIMDIGNKWHWADVNNDELKGEIQRHLRKALCPLVGEVKP